MPPRFIATNQLQTVAEHPVRCFVCAFLSFLVIVLFSVLPKVQASDNIVPNPHVHAAPTNIQPKLVASYGELLSVWRLTRAKSAAPSNLVRCGSDALFLTGDAVVLEIPVGRPFLQNPASKPRERQRR